MSNFVYFLELIGTAASFIEKNSSSVTEIKREAILFCWEMNSARDIFRDSGTNQIEQKNTSPERYMLKMDNPCTYFCIVHTVLIKERYTDLNQFQLLRFPSRSIEGSTREYE